MAVRNPFPGKSQTWLEARLDEVLTEIADGSTPTGGSEGDRSWTAQSRGSLWTRRRMLLQALHVLDAVKYPAHEVLSPRRSRAVFTRP